MNTSLKNESRKYRIAWLPGDGVGVDVLEATKIVLDKIKIKCRVYPWRYWLGILVQRRGRLPSSNHRSFEAGRRCNVWRYHVQTGENSRG